MARKKRNAEMEIATPKVSDTKEVKLTLKPIADSNRLRLYLIDNGKLEGSCFDGVEIADADLRTLSFNGCLVKGSTFKNVNFQGCNLSDSLGIYGNTFIDCDMRWGKKPEEFAGNNKFVNTRL